MSFEFPAPGAGLGNLSGTLSPGQLPVATGVNELGDSGFADPGGTGVTVALAAGGLNIDGAHLIVVNTSPTVTSDAGTPTLDSSASDTAGTVTEGTGTTTTTLTFNAEYSTVPHVLLTPFSGMIGLVLSTVTVAHFVVTHTVGTGGKFSYLVVQ